MRTVVLYGREGCCLCEQARELLLELCARLPFALQERDIDEDDALQRAYLERIPVVTLDGVEAFELFVDEQELERLLRHPESSISPGPNPQGRLPAGAAPSPAGSDSRVLG
jgi:glutaredoxin